MGSNVKKFKTETMLIFEAKQNLIECINKQPVNIAVMSMILREITDEVSQMSGRQYQEDKANYEKEIEDDSTNA